MGKYRKFTPEYRDEAVKLVIETSRPIAEVARELGINDGTIGQLECATNAGGRCEVAGVADRGAVQEMKD